jgi:hypothetical protein
MKNISTYFLHSCSPNTHSEYVVTLYLFVLRLNRHMICYTRGAENKCNVLLFMLSDINV